ncbi:MAG: HEPN domain-containing protein [Oscillospiraceae bacterium]|jgi:HEPN domain-containing protein|nr:HEPN domain-containing protein [Oscillospiraceae bacterium]
MVDNAYVRKWFDKADADYRSSERLFGFYPADIDVICYHCQQSVEKWLKGYLVYRGVPEPPYIHDLIRLRVLCLQFDKQFEAIESECEFLTQFAIIPKYPMEYGITELQAQKAFDYTTAIKNFAPLADLREEIYNQI